MKNKALQTLFIFNGIFVFAASLLGPLYAVFVETIDHNIIFISASWAVFLLSSTVFMFFIRKFGDLIEEKEYLLIAGYFIRAIAWALFPSVETLSGLILLQVILGLGEAVGTPAYDAIFAEHLDKGKQIREYTNWKLISNLAGALAVMIGGIIVNTFGFDYLFYGMSIVATLCGIGLLLKPRSLL